MNISGIRPYAGFYDYNSIKAESLRNTQIAEAADTLSLQQVEEPQTTVTAAPVEQNFGSYDFAQTYRPDATYEHKGRDSDIENLDVQKAVSDLGKDQVLQQYQYFVGSNDSVTKTASAAAQQNLRSGENFTL